MLYINKMHKSYFKDITIVSFQMSLSSKYLQRLDSTGILWLNMSVLEHWPTNHTPITISFD